MKEKTKKIQRIVLGILDALLHRFILTEEERPSESPSKGDTSDEDSSPSKGGVREPSKLNTQAPSSTST